MIQLSNVVGVRKLDRNSKVNIIQPVRAFFLFCKHPTVMLILWLQKHYVCQNSAINGVHFEVLSGTKVGLLLGLTF